MGGVSLSGASECSSFWYATSKFKKKCFIFFSYVLQFKSMFFPFLKLLLLLYVLPLLVEGGFELSCGTPHKVAFSTHKLTSNTTILDTCEPGYLAPQALRVEIFQKNFYFDCDLKVCFFPHDLRKIVFTGIFLGFLVELLF